MKKEVYNKNGQNQKLAGSVKDVFAEQTNNPKIQFFTRSLRYIIIIWFNIFGNKQIIVNILHRKISY